MARHDILLMARRMAMIGLVAQALGCGRGSTAAAPPPPATEVLPAATVDGAVRPMAPDWSLTDLDGQTRRLQDFRGQIVLLNFWATWCPPCREEIPALVRLHAAYRERGVHIIGVAVESGSRHAISQFAQGFGMTYPILLGDIATAQRYRVRGVPVSFLIDGEGRVVRRWSGPYSQEAFATAIDALLAETTEVTP